MKQVNKDNNKSLTDIKKFVEESAKSEYKNYYEDKKIREIKRILEKSSSTESEDFTFTVGDLNAYLG